MLETPLTILRPWQPVDAVHVLALINQNRERLKSTFPRTLAAVFDEASAETFIAGKIKAWEAREGFQLGVWRREAPELLGTVSLLNLDWTVPRAELAYMLGASAEGQGLMSQALPQVLHWAFAELKLARIYARINPNNTRSQDLVQRLGFQLEGRLRHDFRDGNGELTDTLLYALLPADLQPGWEFL